MTGQATMGYGIGAQNELPTLEVADAAVKKAVAVVSVAYVRARDAGSFGERAFRAQVLNDAVMELLSNTHVYQRSAYEAAKAETTADPASKTE